MLALCHRSLAAPRRILEAEDIAQDVYLKFARYWHEKRPPVGDRDSLLSLLAVMTRRLAVDARRWQGRARRDIAREQPGAGQDVADRQDQLAEILLRDLLDKVCKALDGQERQILSLRLQDYNLSEIGEQLNLSVRTVERRLFGIREVLRSQLEL